jgi:hypothetical protein
LYSIQVLRTQKNVFAKNVLSIEEMKQKAQLLGKLYVSEGHNKLLYFFVLVVVISGFVLLFIFKNRNAKKIGKVTEEISSFIELDESEKL